MPQKLLPASLLLSIFFFSKPAFTQIKVGHISIQELVSAMPEYKKAAAEIDDYEKALIQLGDEYRAEYRKQDSTFVADSAQWNSATREVKRKELNSIYLKVINFNQEAQQMMTKKEQELLLPIQQKAVQTTQAVARENGFSYVLSKEQLIAYPATDDLLPLVLKKLNIVVQGSQK